MIGIPPVSFGISRRKKIWHAAQAEENKAARSSN
jgi:hypothetical protein